MRFILLLFPFLFIACVAEPGTDAGPKPEATSLTGKPLYPMPESAKSKAKKDSLLAVAKTNWEANPNDVDQLIWYGRRLAYLSRYNEAIAVYTQGIEQHSQVPELYRHRGHRYLSQRKLDKAISDFETAAELAKDQNDRIEPDGLPNKLNIPLSTLKFNIYYHLGLAHYLKGDFAKAANVYKQCMQHSKNADLLTATSDWLYMTYRRLGQDEAAQQLLPRITPEMNIIENDAYYNRLLMYKGLKEAEALLDFDNITEDNLLNLVTQGYGVGNWYLY
ncbi:MAG: tetratricopeptide repeat protein, partial [Bacteroidota bacterium]